MSSEALQPQVASGAVFNPVRQFFQFMTHPHHTLTDELSQRRARLLSTMTLVMSVIGLGIFTYQFIRYPNIFNQPIIVVIFIGLIFCFGTYIASRLGYIDRAATAFIAITYSVFSIMAFLPGAPDELAYFSILPVLLTAIFFSLRITMRFALLVAVTVVVLGIGFQSVMLPWILQFLVMALGVIFVFITHLRFQEELRSNELKAINVRLRASEENLEQRVQERTRDLQVAADVSLQITTMLDRAALLADVAERTMTAFGLYHVSIFLYDAPSQTLKFQQGVGDAGAMMKEIGKHFALDDIGLVPEAARTQQATMTNDARSNTHYRPNPLLPDTRSELAIPMLHRGKLIGVLDLQSERLGRFTDEDMRILRTLADQIAIAVRNSQLFEETTAALAQAERANVVKSTFLSSMSHELRTPMNAIINFTKFVAKGAMGPINPQQFETLTEVIDSAKHLLNLINDVLDMSKIEAGSLKLFIESDINLNTILKTVQSTGKSLLANKPVELVAELPEELPAFTGDKQRVLQILLNIMSNACKFTDEGRIVIRAAVDNGALVVAVEDTGPGIAPEDHDQVFEAFKQTETGLRQGGGTGLGMPISRSLAEAHGGRLWLESVPGQGSTFSVLLPLDAADVAPTLAVRSAAS